MGCLWHRKNFRFCHINAAHASLGECKSRALPVFHAYSGCDTTFSFHGKGKKSAWQAWHVYGDATEVFVHMAKHTYQLLDVDSDLFQKLERPTVILYDRARPLTSINQTRRELFCYKNHAMEKLPPTQDALLQHIRRAVFQAGTWTTSTQTQQMVPSPENYGWAKEQESWAPVWVTLGEVSAACMELIRCNYKGDCSACKCGSANLDCSPLCRCNCIANNFVCVCRAVQTANDCILAMF